MSIEWYIRLEELQVNTTSPETMFGWDGATGRGERIDIAFSAVAAKSPICRNVVGGNG